MTGSLLLVNATLPDGSVTDVLIDGAFVAALGGGVAPTHAHRALDLAGRLLLPAFAEPHAHLDKAFTANRARNPDGNLPGAIDAWLALRGSLDAEDFATRARRCALLYLANGATAIRTHTDVGPDTGPAAFGAIAGVRDELAGLVDIQQVAMANAPLTGTAGASNRAALHDAIAAGADAVGGAPWIDPAPEEAVRLLADAAAGAGLGLDLHVDETTDLEADTLSMMVELRRRGFAGAMTASHAVSLGNRAAAEQRRIAEAVAAAGINVVTLPQTNLWLQNRTELRARRGLTAVRALVAAGCVVGAGGDNIQDPFNPLGRADPLDTAALLTAAGQLHPDPALHAVSRAAWLALGRTPPAFTIGAPAHFVAVPAATTAEAVAFAPADRIVVRGPQVVRRTSLVHETSTGVVPRIPVLTKP